MISDSFAFIQSIVKSMICFINHCKIDTVYLWCAFLNIFIFRTFSSLSSNRGKDYFRS